jgi:hypothetical protein
MDMFLSLPRVLISCGVFGGRGKKSHQGQATDGAVGLQFGLMGVLAGCVAHIITFSCKGGF